MLFQMAEDPSIRWHPLHALDLNLVHFLYGGFVKPLASQDRPDHAGLLGALDLMQDAQLVLGGEPSRRWGLASTAGSGTAVSGPAIVISGLVSMRLLLPALYSKLKGGRCLKYVGTE
jgi:hypothetical protein